MEGFAMPDLRNYPASLLSTLWSDGDVRRRNVFSTMKAYGKASDRANKLTVEIRKSHP